MRGILVGSCRPLCSLVIASLTESTATSRNSILIGRNVSSILYFRLSLPPTFCTLSARKLKRPNWKPPTALSVDLNGATIRKEDVLREEDTKSNVPRSIFSKLGVQLHKKACHPIAILKNAIYDYFDSNYSKKFVKFDDLSPIVSVKANFDDVLVPDDHASRSHNDTYYVDGERVLRCHTSAHQAELLRSGHTHFLVTGDVYRRDSINSTHYPVFHQMEGVRVFSADELETSDANSASSHVARDLKKCLEGLTSHLFGEVETRWIDAYFPFTNPSFELEIYFRGEWLEVLGCGVMEKKIVEGSGAGWAFGLGLDRLAMVLFRIPDIRLFWSTDSRFLSQFAQGKLGVKYKPFSKYPPCYKDVSFWVGDEEKLSTENDLCEAVRDIAADLVEEVKMIDKFTNGNGRTSQCYRLTYRSMDRSLTDHEVNALQRSVCDHIQTKLNVVLR